MRGAKKWILEIDGADHLSETGKERDRIRDEFLARQGYRVVRVWGYEIVRDGNHVFQMIRQLVEQRLDEREVMKDRSMD